MQCRIVLSQHLYRKINFCKRKAQLIFPTVMYMEERGKKGWDPEWQQTRIDALSVVHLRILLSFLFAVCGAKMKDLEAKGGLNGGEK